MAPIVRFALENSAARPFDWAACARVVRAWGQEQGVCLRDALMLVPFGQHLPLARQAWAQGGGWMPRIETTQTLADAVSPRRVASAQRISFDTANDRLTAAQLLSAQAWAKRWSSRDAHAFAQAVAQLVETGHALLRAAANLHPDERAAYWQRCRQVLAGAGAPGSLERSLALVALEWAATADPPASDVLFELRPSAWIAVQVGRADALTHNLLKASASDTPCALFDADVSLAQPFATLAATGHTGSIRLAVCPGFEDEAQCAAAQVLAHLSQGQQPVALIAQDRLLVRRVRALLERQQVVLQDETGWKLSTTRAAAQVMSLLRAAEARATTNALLDWLKGRAEGADEPLSALESQLRRKGLTRVASVGLAALDGAALGLWQSADSILQTFTSPRRKTLADWLAALGVALRSSGDWVRLQLDDAGQQVLAELGLAQAPATGSAWTANRSVTMTQDEFSAWVDTVLEQASYLPTPGDGNAASAQVVITPLARAVLRPFAAMVFPGADEKRLGPPAKPPVLLGETLAVALGLPASQALREEQTLAFAQALRVPHVTLLRRRVDGADPLAASPLLDRLVLTALRAGAPLGAWVDPRIPINVASQPVERPAPQALSMLPARISASACEALRACPYRFFALHVLRLSEADELEDQIDKRDYGTWLHKVLYEFHRARAATAPAAQDLDLLRVCGAAQQTAIGLDDADFLPFSASFARFAPRYIEWLHGRDAAGAQWLMGEHKVSARPVEMEGVELYGRIDRIDRMPPDVTQLIDYKTGSAQKLNDQLKQPLEDTQLAFYAALMGDQADARLQAIYLALDDTRGIQELPHPHVTDSARQLVAGLAIEYARLRQGAGLPALGERDVCERCEARGLCRRDHWAAT